mgnify:CR=1 FL=1
MLRLKTACAACCLSLLLSALPCYAAQLLDTSTVPEKMYTLSEQELTTLEKNSSELARINAELRTTCNGQEVQLTTLQKQLTQARELSQRLKNQIDSLTAQSAEQRNLIEKTNRLLQESAREEKRTRLRIKRQRNTWEAAAALLACVAIQK